MQIDDLSGKLIVVMLVSLAFGGLANAHKPYNRRC
jgi:hypothetical protein